MAECTGCPGRTVGRGLVLQVRCEDPVALVEVGANTSGALRAHAVNLVEFFDRRRTQALIGAEPLLDSLSNPIRDSRHRRERPNTARADLRIEGDKAERFSDLSGVVEILR